MKNLSKDEIQKIGRIGTKIEQIIREEYEIPDNIQPAIVIGWFNPTENKNNLVHYVTNAKTEVAIMIMNSVRDTLTREGFVSSDLKNRKN